MTPPLQYVLRIADTCLIHAQRLAEWCGHGPVLEEDIALTNMALDLLGQARALLTLARGWKGRAATRTSSPSCATSATTATSRWSSSRCAAAAPTPRRRLRRHRAAQLPARDLAAAAVDAAGVVDDAELAAIAGKALKEARYHQQHAGDWVVRLGDGTDESARRLRAALERAWPYTHEMFERDAVDAAAAASGLGPARDALRERLAGRGGRRVRRGRLTMPPTRPSSAPARRAVHSEHMGFILAEMQSLQRSTPGALVSGAGPARRSRRERRLGRAGRRARPRGAGGVGARTGHRARGAGTATAHGGRAHAHLQRLPGHRGHRRAACARRWTRRLGPVHVTHRLAPAWTTDWISDEGRRKLRAYGIAPPSGRR
jgi:ring-1,2-phenylacetyl-CoA epoxidase subunit PaaC